MMNEQSKAKQLIVIYGSKELAIDYIDRKQLKHIPETNMSKLNYWLDVRNEVKNMI